jgi:predicted nuclease with TOPRIM domain
MERDAFVSEIAQLRGRIKELQERRVDERLRVVFGKRLRALRAAYVNEVAELKKVNEELRNSVRLPTSESLSSAFTESSVFEQPSSDEAQLRQPFREFQSAPNVQTREHTVQVP